MDKEKPSVILAAGRGKRLKELSANKPKPLVRVNGKTILSNLIDSLIKAGTEEIVLVLGYKAELIIEHLEKYQQKVKIHYVINDIYDSTNNIYSLWLAKEYLEAGFFLYEADVFFNHDIVEKLTTGSSENIMVIDHYENRMNGTVVSIDENNRVKQMFLKRHQIGDFDYSDKYKTVNFYKIGRDFYQQFFKHQLENYINHNDVSYYYEAIIKDGIDSGFTFEGHLTGSQKWWEIDTVEDLRITEKIFRE